MDRATAEAALILPGGAIWMTAAALAAVAAMAIVPLVAGPAAGELYGVAASVLAAVPFLAIALVRQFHHVGRSGWWSLILLMPLTALALGQIAFWQVFFNAPQQAAVMMSLARNQLLLRETTIALLLAAFLALATIYVIYKATTRPN